MTTQQVQLAKKMVENRPAENVWIPGIRVRYAQNGARQHLLLSYSDQFGGVIGCALRLYDLADAAIRTGSPLDYIPDVSDETTSRILGIAYPADVPVETVAPTVVQPHRAPGDTFTAYEVTEMEVALGTTPGANGHAPTKRHRLAVFSTPEAASILVGSNIDRVVNQVTVVAADIGVYILHDAGYVPAMDILLSEAESELRKAALAKLTPTERRLLGINADSWL